MVDKIEQKNQCEKHCEHILHNALRGKLKSQNILCKQCGNKLNDEIDIAFVKFFSPVNELFKDYMRKKIMALLLQQRYSVNYLMEGYLISMLTTKTALFFHQDQVIQ